MSLPGNGNARDNSLDGHIGRHTSIVASGSPLVNSLFQKTMIAVSKVEQIQFETNDGKEEHKLIEKLSETNPEFAQAVADDAPLTTPEGRALFDKLGKFMEKSAVQEWTIMRRWTIMRSLLAYKTADYFRTRAGVVCPGER